MYSPVKDGVEKTVRSVRYTEAQPPSHLADLVHCFWELETEDALPEDFCLHALPDACVNILFNPMNPDIAGVTALRTTHEVLNLGRTFHYVGIQLFPGVWQGDPEEVFDRYVGTAYAGHLPLVETGHLLAPLNFVAQQRILSELVQRLVDGGTLVPNTVTQKILTHLEDIRKVADMAALAGLSPRQLQRTLRQTTGFAPHDLLKVLRLQRSFRQDYLASFADQAHYIHSFRKAVGYTPTQYARKYDV